MILGFIAFYVLIIGLLLERERMDTSLNFSLQI